MIYCLFDNIFSLWTTNMSRLDPDPYGSYLIGLLDPDPVSQFRITDLRIRIRMKYYGSATLPLCNYSIIL
jgi:hypothetical protein